MRVPSARAWAALGLAAVLLGRTGAGRAEEAAPPAADQASSQAQPAVGLDRLLKLPSGIDYGVERRAGLTRGEWRQRFAQVEGALHSERRALDAAQGELEKIAGTSSQWAVGPPGTTSTETPLDYRLRQEIKRHKDEIERLEKDKTALDVEANLAGVPPDWRL
jgi:hypothetical protein